MLSDFLQGDPGLFLRLRRGLLVEVAGHVLFDAVGRHHTAEDVVNELWASVFERGSLARFQDRGPGSLRAWFYRAIDHQMVDLFRRSHATKRGGGGADRLLESSMVDARRPSSESRVGPAASAELRDLISFCASELPRNQAEVWRLRAQEGRDFAAIGAQLDITASAARGLFRRAIEKLALLDVA